MQNSNLRPNQYARSWKYWFIKRVFRIKATKSRRMLDYNGTDLLKVLPEVLKSGVADWLFKSKVNRNVKDKSS